MAVASGKYPENVDSGDSQGMVKGRRVQVTLSADLERKLILWAFMHDERLPNWIKIVLRLKVDEVWPETERLLAEKAKRLNMSYEDLEKTILEQAGFDFERERQELEIGGLEEETP